MLIRVSDLQLQRLEFKQDFAPGAVEFGPDFRQTSLCPILIRPPEQTIGRDNHAHDGTTVFALSRSSVSCVLSLRTPVR